MLLPTKPDGETPHVHHNDDYDDDQDGKNPCRHHHNHDHIDDQNGENPHHHHNHDHIDYKCGENLHHHHHNHIHIDDQDVENPHNLKTTIILPDLIMMVMIMNRSEAMRRNMRKMAKRGIMMVMTAMMRISQHLSF